MLNLKLANKKENLCLNWPSPQEPWAIFRHLIQVVAAHFHDINLIRCVRACMEQKHWCVFSRSVRMTQKGCSFLQQDEDLTWHWDSIHLGLNDVPQTANLPLKPWLLIGSVPTHYQLHRVRSCQPHICGNDFVKSADASVSTFSWCWCWDMMRTH